jgi:hypothetical protein
MDIVSIIQKIYKRVDIIATNLLDTGAHEVTEHDQ